MLSDHGQAERYPTLDVIRGFAVMGILIMNVVAMGMPAYAYADPTYYGGSRGADWWAWALAYAFADGKMRVLFTMLFGASLAIVTDRAARPATTHYARMGWLFVFGMLHAWFIWYGDILVEYALVGMLLYPARRWPPRALLLAAGTLLIFGALPELTASLQLTALRWAANLPDASATTRAAWAQTAATIALPHAAIAFEWSHYRGGLVETFEARAPTTWLFQTRYMLDSLLETIGFAALGLGLYRTGFLTGEWPRPLYRWSIAAGLVALMAYVPLIIFITAHGFDRVLTGLTDTLSLILRPFVALGYASALILLVTSGCRRWLTERLAATGRAAFTNYLGTSLIVTTIFYGYGFGLFGQLSRAQLYWVVAAMWLVMLVWSKPWLDCYRYGPFEWLWRSLARGKPQPMRRQTATAALIAGCGS